MADRQKRSSLVRSLSVWSSVPVIVVLAVMGGITVVVMSINIDTFVEQSASQSIGLMEKVIRTEVDGAVVNYLRATAEKSRSLMEMYFQRVARDEMTRDEAWAAITGILLDPGYGRIGETGYMAGVSSTGILVIHPASPGADASKYDFMQQAMAMKNGYLEYEWQNVNEEHPRMKAGYLSYFEPWDVMVWASSYKSEFFSLVDRDALSRTVADIVVGQGGYVLVTDETGAILAGEDQFLVATELPDEGTTSFERKSTDGHFRVDIREVTDLGWNIIVVSPLTTYDTILLMLQIIIGASLVLAALLLYAFIRILLSRRLNPVKEMRVLADLVTTGDLTKRITLSSNDEIGDIGRLFNGIIGEFAGLLIKVKSVNAVLGTAIQNLSTSAQEVASTSNEQAAAVKEVLSTMEDADRVSRDILLKVEEVARIAGSTKTNVEKGFELIKTSLGKMEEIRSTNSDTITGIKTLGERIDSIWEIVNIINGIADQTKIIAFNAELEAAAAGDAGKNFQIVAGEIRRLADGTVNSTNEIKTKINEIQHASDKLIVASEDGTQRISEGWQVSSNIRGIFEEVLNSSEISSKSADEITRSTKMQVSSFEQIFTTLKQISESIDSFVESTSYTNEVSDRLTGIADSFEQQVAVYTVEEAAAPAESGT